MSFKNNKASGKDEISVQQLKYAGDKLSLGTTWTALRRTMLHKRSIEWMEKRSNSSFTEKVK